MWPFRRKPLLDIETARWHLDNFAWAIRNHGRRTGFSQARLVLPAKGFFTAGGLAGHALALALFDEVKAYCGLAASPVGLAIQPGGGQVLGIEPRVTYAPGLIANPQSFIAAMAHELARRLIAEAPETPTIGRQEDGMLADLTAVYLGFGIFLANSAFRVQNHDDGWSYARQGYLPEPELVFALAIFLRVRGLAPAPAFDYLKADLGNMLGQALSDLDGHRDAIRALREESARPSAARTVSARMMSIGRASWRTMFFSTMHCW